MARRSLLTGDERRRLFEPPVTVREVARFYTLSPVDLEWLEERRGPANKLGAAVQMALLRHPGFGWSPGETVPEIVLRFLSDQVHVAPEALSAYSTRPPTRVEHASQLHQRLGLRLFVRDDLRQAVSIAALAARATDKGGPIIEALIADLRRMGIILPSPDTLERVGLAGRSQARRKAAEDLLAPISFSQLERIDQLLVNDPDLKKSPLAWLRDIPESPSAASMSGITERLAYVRAIGIDPAITQTIHEGRFEQYAREGAVAPAFLLSGYSVGRRRATVVAQLIFLESRLSDAAADMFDKMVGSLFAKGRRGRERKYQASSREVSQIMRLFSGVIGAVDQARVDGGDVLDCIDAQVGWWKVLAAKPKIDALAALALEDPLVSAADRYGALRRFVPTFLEHMRFRAGTGGAPLLKALDILRDLNQSGRRELPNDAPLPFASKHWKALVKPVGGPINRRLYETALAATLRDRLRSGDVWIEGSRAYKRFADYLLPKDEVAAEAEALPINVEMGTYLAERAGLLDQRLAAFSRRLSKDDLVGVTLKGEELSVTPVKANAPDEARSLDRAIDALLPRVRITELLREIDALTGFSSMFRELRSGKVHDNPSCILAVVLADATNLGLERMANASQGVTYAQLAWTQSWYLSEENYKAALAKIIEVHHAQPFARHWGDGQASSSDGQFFRSGRRRGGAGEVNAKYGPEPGLRIYTHLSDMHGSFHTRVLSATSSEAPYVLDGLIGRGGGEHYTDTGGATDHVFALCHLLGYRFVPRLRDLKDRRLATIGPKPRHKILEPLLGRPIRVDVIEENWDDVVRLAASIKAGSVAPSVMLKKLSAFKRQNRLDMALAEVGRIERTLFTLDWLESPELRRRCQAGLNKSEARHALAQAVFVHKQGRIADRTLQNQEHRASGLNLVIAAIALWNTLYMQRAVEHLQDREVAAPDELLAHLSPMSWAHVGLTGDYLWANAATAGGFRPLNDPADRLYRVA
ncbi:Tn3 family transposase [Caulobacter segnis]|uniref:Tn3 family transposase n=1 Tax=Caulobacter segnis TaxID=88688 RepID=A0A2W5WT00_9CAUL|nr:Tn3 family transposase [Caulobacter segnis]PZR31084.1 MAG: Tn3 family transposase [Caulobacter segnis]